MRQATVFLLTGWIMAALFSSTEAEEIQFVEDFVLAEDREEALQQLIPGTEDYYYWNCLHRLNQERYEEVEELLANWVARHGETDRVWEIRTRHALLTYDRTPQESLKYLRGRFGIHYPHQQEVADAEPQLPTSLDPKRMSREEFTRRALARHPNSLKGFEDAALEWLITRELDEQQRRRLLARLNRPDHPQLITLIVEELQHPLSEGFGAYPIHAQLLKSQLDELWKRVPKVRDNWSFVRAYLQKLQPNPDVNWRHSPDEKLAYLERLQRIAERLGAVHDPLKAHVRYHRLLLDRRQGVYDKKRFLEYLQSPRPGNYIAKELRESREFARLAPDFDNKYAQFTLFPAAGSDEPLVRDFLAHFLIDANDPDEFKAYIDNDYLRGVFAETKIVHGLGDPEQWASLLSPEPFRRLRERVDIDFAPTNQTLYDSDSPVSLDVYLKNVPTLIVKVFKINAKNYYRETGREIDTDVNLDGLVPNVEQIHRHDDSPFRRVERRFDFSMLDQPGVYIIDFIGNGESSRALVRKGRLRHVVKTTAAGQRFTIFNERNQQVTDARIFLGGHEYTADERGHITVPFSTDPGRRPIVITAPVSGNESASYSALSHFQHQAEQYDFSAGFYVDRESLLPGRTAAFVIRPSLKIHDTPVSLELLEDVKLTLTSTDLDGVSSTVEVTDFPLFEDRESVHEFQVPHRLARLQVRLTAKITETITGKSTEVAAVDSFTLNQIDRTEQIDDWHLLQDGDEYVLELRGKTGEPKASRPLTIAVKHREFREPIRATLKTDAGGRVGLGELDGIESFIVEPSQGNSRRWELRNDRHSYSRSVHAREGEPIVLPYLGQREQPSRDELSLLELRGGTFSVDRFDHLRVEDELLTIASLPAGDFDLLLKESGTRILLRVTAGETVGSFIVGNRRQLETSPLKPVQISKVTSDDEQVTIQLRNFSSFTRVHLYGTRYYPEYSVFRRLGKVHGSEPYLFQHAPAPSVYLTGRDIGDEYRYIIDRRYASKYPGNMLERPSLLLNPWVIRDTETGEQVAAKGDEFQAEGEPAEESASRAADMAAKPKSEPHNFANLDFLASGAAAFTNLTPDDEGKITIPREAIGKHHYLSVVAVDPVHTTCRRLALPAQGVELLDLRLLDNLDPQQHYTQQKRVRVVPEGETFTLRDITTARFESYDNLARVYQLYATLSKSPELAEFAFLLQWPNLNSREKLDKYSRYACHELHFFLSRKDPAFFQAVVSPYLRHKKDKKFMDDYLLEEDLSRYLEPWNYGQLNMVERILLGRRIDGEGDRTARHVNDLYDLLPPRTDQFIRLFDTAVQRSALEVDDALGLKDQLQATLQRDARVREEAAERAAPAAAPSSAAGLGGGFGSMGGSMAGGSDADPFGEEAAKFGESKARAMLQRRRAGRRLDQADTKGNAELEELDEDSAYFFDKSALDQRKMLRQLYRQPEPTKEWAENNYYHLPIDQQDASLITVNAFWNDFAAHDPSRPFLSNNLATATGNLSEMLLALAVLDLPFDAPEHQTDFEQRRMSLTPGGPVVIFHEQIQPVGELDSESALLVSQNFFRHGDRYRTVNGEKVDKFVTDEFLIHTVYGCQVVMTNPTSTRKKLTALLQIPCGAIPVLGHRQTATVHVDLEPYHTHRLEYYFYFPTAGEFPHFPVHVARHGELVAAADPVRCNVVEHPSRLDKQSWEYVSQYGSLDDVVNFLNEHNVEELNLERIAWRMHDANASHRIVTLLKGRHAYNHTLWSYALKHNDVAAANEYLRHAERVVSECGGPLRSTLLTIHPIRGRTYEHLEYSPLINARTHALGRRRQIVNERLYWQYHHFLKQLSYCREPSDEQRLALTYYMLLQDRIEESLAIFQRVRREQLDTNLQYDYCHAYLKFFTEEPEAARQIVEKHVDHPVNRWRNRFATVLSHLDEASGEESEVIDPKDRRQQQGALAATEPDFDFSVVEHELKINYQNLGQVRINFYEVDVELLFSRNPFVRQFGTSFAPIEPNHSLQVELPADELATSVELPTELKNSNLLVEVVGAGETRTQAHFAHSLSLQLIENYGQLKLLDRESHKPLSKAYVKVFARIATGEVKFYKDGYTDLRGRFDYASLSTPTLGAVQEFAILVISEENGAAVRQATPPKR